MKKISCLLFLLLPTLLFAANQKVLINGKIKGLGTNQIVFVNSDRERVATCVSEDDKFSIEFDFDLSKDIVVLMYLPHLDSDSKIQPNNTYSFLLDNEVELSGRIKETKVLDFKAKSVFNDQYNFAKFNTPSAKERIKISAQAKKAWDNYRNYINPTGNPEDHKDVNSDTKAKSLLDEFYRIEKVVSEINFKCTFESSEMLTSDINKGLNALLYTTCNGLKYEYLKLIIDNFRKHYTDSQIESEYYMNALLDNYKIKAVRNSGEPLYDFDFVDVKGNIVNLKNFKGKYLYVNIYDINYEPSMTELKKIEELEINYKDKNIVFLNLNVNRDREEWRKFCESNKYTNHINVNDNRPFFGVYRVNDLPRGILIDEKGLIHTFNVGYLFGEYDAKNDVNFENGKTIDVILKEIF